MEIKEPEARNRLGPIWEIICQNSPFCHTTFQAPPPRCSLARMAVVSSPKDKHRVNHPVGAVFKAGRTPVRRFSSARKQGASVDASRTSIVVLRETKPAFDGEWPKGPDVQATHWNLPGPKRNRVIGTLKCHPFFVHARYLWVSLSAIYRKPPCCGFKLKTMVSIVCFFLEPPHWASYVWA